MFRKVELSQTRFEAQIFQGLLFRADWRSSRKKNKLYIKTKLGLICISILPILVVEKTNSYLLKRNKCYLI